MWAYVCLRFGERDERMSVCVWHLYEEGPGDPLATYKGLLSCSKDMDLSPLSLSSRLYRLKSLSLDSEFGRGRADTDGSFDRGLARTLRQSQSTQSAPGASAYASPFAVLHASPSAAPTFLLSTTL